MTTIKKSSDNNNNTTDIFQTSSDIMNVMTEAIKDCIKFKKNALLTKEISPKKAAGAEELRIISKFNVEVSLVETLRRDIYQLIVKNDDNELMNSYFKVKV